MAKYSAVKATVNAYIKQNGRKEITGRILNAVLNATIDSLGKYFQFAGGALPTDDPGTPDQNVCYLAGEPGVYTNFGGITIENEEVALLFWDGEWTKQRILIGIREVNASVDSQVGTPSVDVSYSGGELVLTFHNLKGEQGETGDPAGFGTIGADINGGVGTPGVSVETSGDNTAKNLMFHFTNLKGETGVTSVVATIDDTSGTPSCQVSLVGQQLTLAFSGLKGLKGDTGVSADYPITIYNGLDSDATDQALAAAQGKVLDGKVSQLGQELSDLNCVVGYESTPVTAFSAFDASNSTNSSMATAPFIISLNETSLIINKIKLNVVSTGTLTIGKIRKEDVIYGHLYDATKVYAKRQITISATGIQEIYLDSLFVFDYELIAIGGTSDTVTFKYGPNGTNHNFYYIDSNGKFNKTSNCMGIDFIGERYATDASRMIIEAIKKSIDLQEILGESIEDVVLYKGYGDGDSTQSSIPANSPFIPQKSILGKGLVTGIKLFCGIAGTLTIGKIKKSDVVIGSDYNRDLVTILATVNIVEGENLIPLNVIVYADEYIAIGLPSDTGIFRYGTSTSADSGFIYCAPNGKYTSTTSSIGVDIYVTQIIGNESSVYRGKRISILGDSISTFSGWIPSGNETYYPSGTVQSVQDTWWKKLIDALGLVLDTNNSWSGSRVTTTGGETSAGCMTRSQSLGSPDVIIVWMGINDFNNEVALGTYDGKSGIPTATTSFREAYGIMLNKILTAYPTAEVWVCTLPQCERSGSTGFPEINGNGIALVDFNIAIEELARAFGVKVLDHNRCGLTYQNMSVYNPDQLHPTKGGHSLIANNDIRQMDNAVRKRC